MLRSALALALASAMLAAPAAAQDVDELLDKHYAAIGGLDSWKSIESMKRVGTMAMGPGMQAPFTVYQKRPNKVRVEIAVQGMTGVQAYDGETAWWVMPFMGVSEPTERPGSMVEQIVDEADIDGPLVGWKESGNTLELVGKADADGTEAYKIQVTDEAGEVMFWYLDAEKHMLIMFEGKAEMQGRVVEFETLISDYRDVGGLQLPHMVVTRPKGGSGGQTITFDTIEVNVDIDDGLFKMPTD